MQHIGISGEIGDALYAFPTIRAIGIRNIVNLERPWARPHWLQRSKSLKRLAEAQPYIDSFEDYSGQPILDLSTYRNGGQRYGETIIERIARWARVQIEHSPWLTVEPSSKTKGCIVVARCPRWKAYSWPYKALVAAFGREMVFLGTDDEYKAFCAEFGFIDRLYCSDMLEVAQAIAGSELFIGNQSSPFAIAEGLGHPSVLEVCPFACDCLTFRANCIYSADGEMEFTVLGKTFTRPSIVQPYCAPVGDKVAYGKTPFECETVARAMYLIHQLPLPSLKEIQASVEETHRKAA